MAKLPERPAAPPAAELKQSVFEYVAGVLTALLEQPASYYVAPSSKLQLRQVADVAIHLARQTLAPLGAGIADADLFKVTEFLPRRLRLPVSHVMGWPLPAGTYVLLPGFAFGTGSRPGPLDRHFIDAEMLAKLYGVEMCECVVVPFGDLASAKSRWPADAIKLAPRSDGNYRLPTKEPN